MSLNQRLYIACILIMGISIGFIWNKKLINPDFHLIWSDSEGYYMYLPALFIYDGFKDVPIHNKPQFSHSGKTGSVVNKYTYGTALMEAPFFLVGHFVTKWFTGLPANGYSQFYQFSVVWAGLIYSWLGLLVLFKFLRRKYDVFISLLVPLIIYFGTNLFYYSSMEAGMSHVYSFFLFSLLVYFTQKLYDSPSVKSFLIISFLMGLIVFIRPTNIIIVVFVLFYGVMKISDITERLIFVKRHFFKFLIFPLPFIVLIAFQVMIWSHTYGELTFWSYSGESFSYWARPKILLVLFDVQNGFFIYAPLMLLAMAGLIMGIIKKQDNFWVIGLIFVLGTYIFSSWWAWWFGGAYGHRAYVEMLALFTIPMGYILHHIIYKGKKIWKNVSLGFILVFIFLSLEITVRYIPPWDGPNWGWEDYFEIISRAVLFG